MSVWVKICGLTDADAVQAALDAGADAIGFVFAKSVRQVTPAVARQLAAPARGRVNIIAVTQHPSAAQVAQILEEFAPDVLQSDIQDIAGLQLGGRCAVLPVLRAGRSQPSPLPPRLLFEGPASGTGEVADWTQAAHHARHCELVLAGGLNAGNVAAAVSFVRPFGVDVSSGVEAAPGRKSIQKIFDFVRAARAAAMETS